MAKRHTIRINAAKKESSAKRIAEMLQDCPDGTDIIFEPGEYRLYSNDCIKEKYYFTNSDSEVGDELSGITYLNKNLAIYLKGKKDITVDGGGALFLVHGEMTPILIDGCEDITVKNLSVDYVRATVSEMKITEVTDRFFTVKVNNDSPFVIREDKVFWVGDTFSNQADETQIADPETGMTWRTYENFTDYRAEQLGANMIKFHFPIADKVKNPFLSKNKEAPKKHGLEPGRILQVRNRLRNQAGAFITESGNVRFEDINMHFMHGLGIVGQCSKNLTFERISCAPRKKTGRTCAGFADFMHFNSVRGKLTVKDCCFSGSQDDGINVHGTHVKYLDKLTDDTITAAFIHPQTLGFQIFRPKDKIEFVNPFTLRPIASAVVEKSRLLNSKVIELTLFDPVPKGVVPTCFIENVTATPEVLIENNVFELIPTRGILASSRRKTVIKGNTFNKCGMAGILVCDDARSWFESGRVEDLTIENNSFNGCCHDKNGKDYASVTISPETFTSHLPLPRPLTVHKNIDIKNNNFAQENSSAVYAGNTDKITVSANNVIGSCGKKPVLEFLSCTGVRVLGNSIKTPENRIIHPLTPKKEIIIEN